MWGTDRLFTNNEIVLSPHDGPNGAYAHVGENDTLSVDLRDPGVNLDALTVVAEVFDVSNHGTVPTRVWISHNATDHVAFYSTERGSIEGESNSVSLDPGETLVVSIRIDTNDVPAGQLLIQQIHVNARKETTPTPTTVSGSGGGGVAPATTSAPAPTTAAPPTSAPSTPAPGTPIGQDESVVVDFGGGQTGGQEQTTGLTVSEVDVAELVGPQDGSNQAGPEAIVRTAQAETQAGGTTGTGTATPTAPTEKATVKQQQRQAKLQAAGADALATVGEPVSLSGDQSLIGTVHGVDPKARIVKAVDVHVPSEMENRPAAIRITTKRSRFGSSDPREANIGHLTPNGWQLLDTHVVSITDSSVVLEARTSSFSPFAVFAGNDVSYDWTLPNGETFSGKNIRTQFEEPGVYNVTLTVTDAFGKSSTAPYRILVNDPPTVSFETIGNLTAGTPVTLRANVDNQVGEVNVSWTFSDGTVVNGTEVQHTFEAGPQVVKVTAEDEYGATGQAERTLVVSSVSGGEPYASLTGLAGSVEAWFALFALLALVVLVLARWSRAVRATAIGVLYWLLPFAGRRRPPRITVFDGPRVDLDRTSFEIARLRVEDAGGDLETVTVVVEDVRGNEVGKKVVDVGGKSEYVARGERISPRSRVYVRPGESYTFRVTATDAHDAVDEQSRDAGSDSTTRRPSPPRSRRGVPDD